MLYISNILPIIICLEQLGDKVAVYIGVNIYILEYIQFFILEFTTQYTCILRLIIDQGGNCVRPSYHPCNSRELYLWRAVSRTRRTKRGRTEFPTQRRSPAFLSENVIALNFTHKRLSARNSIAGVCLAVICGEKSVRNLLSQPIRCFCSYLINYQSQITRISECWLFWSRVK